MRTVQPLAVALVLLRIHEAGRPAPTSHAALQQALADTAYPERASDADRDLGTPPRPARRLVGGTDD